MEATIEEETDLGTTDIGEVALAAATVIITAAAGALVARTVTRVILRRAMRGFNETVDLNNQIASEPIEVFVVSE